MAESHDIRLEELRAVKANYVHCWKILFKYLLNWPEDKVKSWVDVELEAWTDPRSLIPTELPEYYVAMEILPSRLKRTLGQRCGNVAWELERIISDNGQRDVRKYPPSEWAKIRTELNDFLRNYGTSLPE